jgi:hypothetical protein
MFYNFGKEYKTRLIHGQLPIIGNSINFGYHNNKKATKLKR